MNTSATVQFTSGTFSGTQIKSAILTEQIHPLSIEVPSSVLRLTLFSTGTFSVVDPNGFLASLQYKQPLDVYGNVTGTNLYMGKFFLDEWRSLSENEAEFVASDGVGLLDTTFYGGLYDFDAFGLTTANAVAVGIFTGTATSYAMDSALEDVQIDGWIPVTTRREALQQLCFRLGAYATSTKDDIVNIRQTELASALPVFDHVITASQKGLNQPLTLRPLVTAVELKSHDYTNYILSAAQQTELFNATLSAGQYTILFSKAKFGTGISGTATYVLNIVEANRWVVTILTPGTFIVTLTGDARDDMRVTVVENGSLPAGTAENRLSIMDALLITSSLASTVTQRVYDYYQQRYVQRVRLYAKNVSVGDSALVYAQGKWIAGIVERTEIDLAGGFITTAEIVGSVWTGCDNILTENTTVADGGSLSYVGCLNMLDFNLTLQGEATLAITQ